MATCELYGWQFTGYIIAGEKRSPQSNLDLVSNTLLTVEQYFSRSFYPTATASFNNYALSARANKIFQKWTVFVFSQKLITWSTKAKGLLWILHEHVIPWISNDSPRTPCNSEAIGLFSFGPKFTFLTALYLFLLFFNVNWGKILLRLWGFFRSEYQLAFQR